MHTNKHAFKTPGFDLFPPPAAAAAVVVV